MNHWKMIKETNWAQDPDIVRVAKQLRGRYDDKQVESLEDFVYSKVEELLEFVSKEENQDIMDTSVFCSIDEDMSDDDAAEFAEQTVYELVNDIVGHGEEVFNAVLKTPLLLARWAPVGLFSCVFLPLEDLEDENAPTTPSSFSNMN